MIYTRPVGRWLLVMCLLAACPGTPKSTVGRTRETAIAVAMITDAADLVPGTLSADVESPQSAPPHWYRVTLPGPMYVGGAALDKKGTTLAVDLFTADGKRVGPNDVGSGTIEIRVSGTAASYRLQLRAMPERKPPIQHSHCNPNKIDPANPNCAGVVGCDHNHPDFSNPSCCSMLCLRGPCAVEIIGPADGPNDMYAWIRDGAKSGVVVGSFGAGELPMQDGTWKRMSIRVVEVEAERSKVVVGPGVNRAGAVHSVVNLNPPLECSAKK